MRIFIKAFNYILSKKPSFNTLPVNQGFVTLKISAKNLFYWYIL